MTFDQAFDALISHEGGLSFGVATSWVKQFAFRDPSFYSPVNRAWGHAENFASVFKQKLSAFKSNVSVCPSIARLLGSRGPSAIFLAVIPVVINSVKRAIFWPSSHIGKKVFKSFPSLAVCDSSSSIILPLRSVRVVTTALHGSPYSVLRCRASNRFPVGCCLLSGKLTPKTPATNDKPTPERVHCRDSSIATITNILPVAMLGVSLCASLCDNFSESLP